MKKSFSITSLIVVLIYILGIVGWGKCVYKAFTCNWEPIGKAEILYTVGAFTGIGAIVGWIDIQDN